MRGHGIWVPAFAGTQAAHFNFSLNNLIALCARS